MASYREQSSTDRFEKRRIPRFPVQLPAQIGQDRNDISSICTNLSSEGVLVETSKPLSVGQRISIVVWLTPEQSPLRMFGQVVWRQDGGAFDPNGKRVYELGIRFVRSSPNSWQLPQNSEYEMEYEENDFLGGVA